MRKRTHFGDHGAVGRRTDGDGDAILAFMLSGVLAFVSFFLLRSSLPPNCHRTRLKDVKTRPHEPGLDIRFLACQSGEEEREWHRSPAPESPPLRS
jgi:hypothetical protein